MRSSTWKGLRIVRRTMGKPPRASDGRRAQGRRRRVGATTPTAEKALQPGRLEHDPEKWIPVFRKRSCSSKKTERDDDSKKSHLALDSQRMPHLHCHLLSSTAELALGKLLVSEIEHHKGDANGSQCFHKRPPNQLPRVKRQRLFELGHCEEKMGTAVARGEGHSRRGSLYRLGYGLSPGAIVKDIDA